MVLRHKGTSHNERRCCDTIRHRLIFIRAVPRFQISSTDGQEKKCSVGVFLTSGCLCHSSGNWGKLADVGRSAKPPQRGLLQPHSHCDSITSQTKTQHAVVKQSGRILGNLRSHVRLQGLISGRIPAKTRGKASATQETGRRLQSPPFPWFPGSGTDPAGSKL